MGSDEAIIYGQGNGALYRDDNGKEHTYWEPKLVIQTYGDDCVSLGIFPVDHDQSTHNAPVYDTDRVLYINLNRGGANRAIRALRSARDRAFGKDE